MEVRPATLSVGVADFKNATILGCFPISFPFISLGVVSPLLAVKTGGTGDLGLLLMNVN